MLVIGSDNMSVTHRVQQWHLIRASGMHLAQIFIAADCKAGLAACCRSAVLAACCMALL